MNENNKMVAVATAAQPVEATMLQIELGACGIDSELDGEFTVAANPLLSNAIGGVKVLVPLRDAEQAMSILAANSQAKAAQEAAQAKTCPKCNHENGEDLQRPNWFGIVSVITLGAFTLFYPWPKYQCPNCNHKWK